MPIVRHASIQAVETRPGLLSIRMVDREMGAESLTISEITIAPGAAIPLHIHPTHQEAIVILEGELESVLGDESGTLGAGHTILAPTRVKHSLTNHGDRPAKILAIFPTVDVQRQPV